MGLVRKIDSVSALKHSESLWNTNILVLWIVIIIVAWDLLFITSVMAAAAVRQWWDKTPLSQFLALESGWFKHPAGMQTCVSSAPLTEICLCLEAPAFLEVWGLSYLKPRNWNKLCAFFSTLKADKINPIYKPYSKSSAIIGCSTRYE